MPRVPAMSALLGLLLAFAAAAPPGGAAEPGDLLAEGPHPVAIVYTTAAGKNITDTGTLFRLTAGKLVYRSAKGGAVQTLAPAPNDKGYVDIDGTKARVRVDPKSGLFTGDALPRDPVHAAPVAFKKGEEERYLLASLARLQAQIDAAAKLGDAAGLKAAQKRAGELGTHAAKTGLSRKLVDEFEALDAYAKAQADVVRRERELYAEAYKEVTRLNQERAAALARRDAQAAFGMFQAFVSAIPTTDSYSYDPYTRTLTENQSVDAAGVASGVGSMVQSQLIYAQDRTRLEIAQEMFVQDTAARQKKLQEEFRAAQKARTQKVRALGARLAGLPAPAAVDEQEEVAELFRQNSDRAALVAVLEGRAKEARGQSPHDDPYVLAEVCALKAATPRADVKPRVEEAFAQAQVCAAAAKLIPEAKVYDADRRDILLAAAGLAAQAAALEVGPRPSADAYSLKALYALRLLDAPGVCGVADTTGEARELRACALLQVGRGEEALEAALGLTGVRAKSATFHYNLARFYCAQGKAKDGFTSFEKAVKLGYGDIKAARATADLAPLRGDKNFAGLTTVNVQSFVVPPRGAFGGVGKGNTNVQVTNRSPFALTNVKVRLTVTPQGAKSKTYSPTSDALISRDETHTWQNACPLDPAQRQSVKLTIESDQGTITVLPALR